MGKTLLIEEKAEFAPQMQKRVAREVGMRLHIGSTGGGKARAREDELSTLLLTPVHPSASTPRSDTASVCFSATPSVSPSCYPHCDRWLPCRTKSTVRFSHII